MTNHEKPRPIPKGRVTMCMDQDIIDTFKHLAATEERNYQTMINKVLRDYINNLPPEQRYHNR